MTGWTMKRFWTHAGTTPVDGGFAIILDDRPVRTPAKAPLVVPTLAMAKAAAAEWEAQTETVDPRRMPVTRSANAAIDKVRTQQAEVAALISAYGESDLLCYRADGPEGLVTRQAEAWDPLLDWAATALNARLICATGVVHVDQDPQAVAALSARVAGFDPFGLTALHDLVSLSGSLVIGLAVTQDIVTPDHAWNISRIDEDWQAEVWGEDAEAAALAAAKREDFLHAHRFFCLSRGDH